MESAGYLRGASELINVREFIQKWDPLAIPGIPEKDKKYIPQRDVLAKELNVERATVTELESVCCVDNLLCGDEGCELNLMTNIPDNIELVSVQQQKRDVARREKDKLYYRTVLRKLKYSSAEERLQSALHAKRITQDELNEWEINLPNVILTVQVYAPLKNLRLNHGYKIIPELTFNVLGTQKLSDLRDRITCANDLAVAHDLSDCPESEDLPYAKDIYKSGLFYIEGVFYNDMRYPDCHDYSSQIMAWAKEPGRPFGNMTSEKMEESLFVNLSVRLGQPYCYLHQGDCEHLIVFTDIRLFNSDDSLDIRDYPRLMKKKRITRCLCRVCQMHSARWIVYNTEFAPENPCFFCDHCYKAFHYDENGQKLGDFKAYKFFDQSAASINL